MVAPEVRLLHEFIGFEGFVDRRINSPAVAWPHNLPAFLLCLLSSFVYLWYMAQHDPLSWVRYVRAEVHSPRINKIARQRGAVVQHRCLAAFLKSAT